MCVPKLRARPEQNSRKGPGPRSTLLRLSQPDTLGSPRPHDEGGGQGGREASIFHDRNRHNT
ncbi:hypothetical protein BD413DRAFT_512400 [Trametes elegans]|nr:hypothetical protein BD413DRAFT_512400 [Trametes elegans]